jgi:hypothetical protein
MQQGGVHALRVGVPTAAANLIAWALERKNLIPDWAPDAVLLFSIPMLAWAVWPGMSRVIRKYDRTNLRWPMTISKPMSEEKSGHWTLETRADGHVLMRYGTVERALDPDAITAYWALRDNERERVWKQFHSKTRWHYTRDDILRIRDGRAAQEERVGHDVEWLLDLHAAGTHFILNRPITLGELRRLEIDSTTWSDMSRKALESTGASSPELSRFTIAQNVQPIQSGIVISPNHQGILNVMNHKLTILRQVAERLEAEHHS